MIIWEFVFCNIEDVLSLLFTFVTLLFAVVVFNNVLFVVVFTRLLLLFEWDIFVLNVEFVLLHKINELLLLVLLFVLLFVLVLLVLLKPFRVILDEVPGV